MRPSLPPRMACRHAALRQLKVAFRAPLEHGHHWSRARARAGRAEGSESARCRSILLVSAHSWLVGEPRPPTAACAPDGPHNHAISIEREVDVDGDALQEDPAHSRDLRVARSDPWKCGDQVERAIEIRRKRLDVLAIGHPPVALAKDVATRGSGEQNLSALHVERSSRKTSSALTRRPASRSPSDWRRASCNAARSASSSQSPGSRGRSSTSVPSGRSVGSSNTSRPARTRAFSVMDVVYPANAPWRRPGMFAANTVAWWAPQIRAGDVVRVFLCIEPVDMPLGFDRLAQLARERVGQTAAVCDG